MRKQTKTKGNQWCGIMIAADLPEIITWGLHGDYMGITWGLHGDYMAQVLE